MFRVLKDAVLVASPGPLGHGGSGGWERFEEFCDRRFGRPA